MSHPRSIVLFGYGNPSRGDDALGPLLLARAEAWVAERPGLGVRVVEDFQLQIEHAEDLRDQDLALFLDADAAALGPCRLRQVLPTRDESYTTHELSPGAVLEVFERVSGRVAPPAFVLGLRAVAFDLGAPLSPAAEASLEAGWALLRHLLEHPDPEAWMAHLTAVGPAVE